MSSVTRAAAERPWFRLAGPRIALGGAGVAALTVLQLTRQTGTPSWRTIWAEDGSVYTTDALNMAPLHTVFRGYAGYVQLLPRLLALVVRLFPVARVAIVLAGAAALCCALLAGFVFVSTERWIRSTGLRLLVATMVALVPAASLETTANIANLGWPLLVATFWAFVSRRETVVDTVLRCVVVVVTALTTTVAAVLAPLALIVALRRPARRDRIVAGCYAAALAVQIVLDRSAGSPPPKAPSSVADVPQVFGVRVLGSIVWGERWLPDVWSSMRWGLVGLAVVALAVVVSLSLSRASTDQRWFAAAALVSSVALFVVPVWIRGTGYMHLRGDPLNVNASRYVIVPIVVAISGLAVLVDGSGRRWLRNLVLAHGALLILVSLRMPTGRSGAHAWPHEVSAAAATCRDQPALSTTRIVISPTVPGSPWTVIVPCDRLR